MGFESVAKLSPFLGGSEGQGGVSSATEEGGEGGV